MKKSKNLANINNFRAIINLAFSSSEMGIFLFTRWFFATPTAENRLNDVCPLRMIFQGAIAYLGINLSLYQARHILSVDNCDEEYFKVKG
jgi:hypothetical protein